MLKLTKVLFIVNDFLFEPLGIMSLIAVLKKNNHEVELLKINAKYKEYGAATNEEEMFEFAERFSPDVILYSITTGVHKHYLAINRKLKQRFNFLSVFGGMHVSFFPDFINEDSVDVICIGEGEYALLELADNLENGNDIKKIKNLFVKDKKGNIHKNPLRPLIQDLDSLPFPDRELVYRYKDPDKNLVLKNFITTRGCSYRCSYCFNDGFFNLYKLNGESRVRSRSADNVIEEILDVKKKYGLKIVYFQDDILSLNKNFKDLMNKYPKEVGHPFHAHIRPDLVNEEIVRLLKECGCLSVTMSLESANDNTRKLIKRGLTKEQIYNAAKLLHKYEIKFRLENMLGLPHEDLNDAFETLEMNIKCKPALGWASIFQPYPGTELFDYTKENGLFDGDIDSFDGSFFKNSILNLENKYQIENLQKLFSFTVSFPIVKPLTKQIIKFPPNKFFGLIHDKWKRHCFNKRLYKANGFKY